MAEKIKNPRLSGEDDEDIGALRLPDAKRIACRDCKFREEDRMNGKIPGAILSMCEQYFDKPNDVLWDNADCPKWESDDEGEEE